MFLNNHVRYVYIFIFFFFFFKQKTAYEMLRSLVGSEMCIRDRVSTQSTGPTTALYRCIHNIIFISRLYSCLLYTSDAADEEDSVDLGGRRIIKKKKKKEKSKRKKVYKKKKVYS
eukprot:TRINITY_DN24627_c0_g1_i2.p1 TRINITY_DN24627_c0_g1~~TRINITY_DN24627_c0_g1_i2.p1  ORF type:complete len:115 (-),score=43.02 TRINITY_DN24627_c0_g1_i2:48-392(-)